MGQEPRSRKLSVTGQTKWLKRESVHIVGKTGFYGQFRNWATCTACQRDLDPHA